MKNIILIILFAGFVINTDAISPKLDHTIELMKSCLADERIPLCDRHLDEMISELRKVDLDARGEFVYVLKDVLKNEYREEVVVNLYEKLSVVAPLYVAIDGRQSWSGRDMLLLLADISIEYIKYTPLEAENLTNLFKQQTSQNSRYKFLGALHGMMDSFTEHKDIEEVISFGLFAKSHIKTQGDEYYIFQSAVELIKKLTVKNLTFVRGFEGIYDIELQDAEAARILRLDHLVISSADQTNGLLLNFVSSTLRSTKFKFKGAVLLGHSVLSNIRLFEDRNDLAAPEFKFDIDFDSTEIKGTFYTKRFGAVPFVGKQRVSNGYLYEGVVSKELVLEEILGTYPVQVGNYMMTLRIEQGIDNVEMSLVNDNAMVIFTNPVFNTNFGIIKAIDWKNENIIELKVLEHEGELHISGHFINSSLGHVFNIRN